MSSTHVQCPCCIGTGQMACTDCSGWRAGGCSTCGGSNVLTCSGCGGMRSVNISSLEPVRRSRGLAFAARHGNSFFALGTLAALTATLLLHGMHLHF